MKRYGSKLLLALLVFAVIVGCSSNSGGNADPGANNNQPNPDTGGNNAETPAADPYEVVLWVAGNSQQQQDTYNAIIASFNEQYGDRGLSASVQYVPWAELQQKLTTSLAGRVGPDLFMHGSAAAAGFAALDQLEPLDAYFAEWDEYSDYIEAYMSAGVVDGSTYVLPTEGANRMFIYRKDIFEEAGVDVPETWEELKEISEKLLLPNGERYPTTLPTSAINLQQAWTPYLWANGGQLFNDDFSAAAFHSPEGVEALEFYKSFFDEGLTPIEGVQGQGDQHPLGTGEIAFIVDGVYILEQIKNYTPDAYDQLAIAPPPAGKGEPTTLVGSAGIYMNAGSNNKDAAWELMSFIGNRDNQAKIAEELKFLPVRHSLVDADFVTNDPLFQRFVELSATVNGEVNPNIPKWTAVRDILASHIEMALYGQVSAEEALNNAAAEVDNELAK